MITSFRFFFVYEGLEILNLTTSQTKRSYNDSNFFHIFFSLKIQQGPFSDFNNYLNNY